MKYSRAFIRQVLEEVVGIGLRGGWMPGSSTQWKARSRLSGSVIAGEEEDVEVTPAEAVLDGSVLKELLRM